MADDPYRAPNARLERAPEVAGPRSLLVAVLLASLTVAALFVLSGLVLVPRIGVLAFSDAGTVLAVGGVGNFIAGWIAARYRRGSWLSTSLWLIALGSLPSLYAIALTATPQRPARWVLLHFGVRSLCTIGGGWLGWGRRARAG